MQEIDAEALIRQIGGWTVLGMSGGRWRVEGGDSVVFPVGRGVLVRVTLDPMDTYTVTRERTVLHGSRRGAVVTETEIENVYAEEISEICRKISFAISERLYNRD